MTTSNPKMKSRVFPFCFGSPLSRVCNSIPAPGVNLIRDQWPDRTESIESFAAGKLNVLLLQIARGHVVHACVPENVGTHIFIRAQVAAGLADHHPKFALEIDSV